MIQSQKNFLEGLFLKIKTISQSPLPQGFIVSSYWNILQNETIQAAIRTNSVQESIYISQESRAGFDHRGNPSDVTKKGISILDITKQRFALLTKLFPNSNLKQLPQESRFSRQETIIKIQDREYSNIFLYHLYFFLRVTDSIARNKSKYPINAFTDTVILEIGGGYGGLARIFSKVELNSRYIICDLAESLFFSYIFLTANFPDKVILIADSDDYDASSFDILLVPVQHFSILRNYQYEAIINTGSLQEMPDQTIHFWMQLIKSIIGKGIFYSFNYFLNDNKSHTSLVAGEFINKTCFRIDNYWDIVRFKINPDVLIADAISNNWLELIGTYRSHSTNSSEMSFPTHNIEEHLDSSADHMTKLLSFEQLWILHFKDPSNSKYIILLLKTIDQFKRGHIGNNVFPATPKARLLDECKLLNLLHEDIYSPLYGEEIYLKEMLLQTP